MPHRDQNTGGHLKGDSTLRAPAARNMQPVLEHQHAG